LSISSSVTSEKTYSEEYMSSVNFTANYEFAKHVLVPNIAYNQYAIVFKQGYDRYSTINYSGKSFKNPDIRYSGLSDNIDTWKYSGQSFFTAPLTEPLYSKFTVTGFTER